MPNDESMERWARERPVPPAPGFVAARLARERGKSARLAQAAAGPLNRRRSPHYLVPRTLALSGLGELARRNALAIGLTRREYELPALPVAFEGFRVLHVSDPHFGAHPELDDAIVASVAGIEHDLCVMTGDYRYRSYGPIDVTLANLARLVASLDGNVSDAAPLAVLGNHDSIGMVPPMEALGIEVLLNDCTTLRRGGAALHVAGIDDPRYYRLDDLDRALAARDDRGRPQERLQERLQERSQERPSATLLLAHSPERADAAAAAGCDAYLCGHTHGGQVCLPGGHILMRNARAPLERLTGEWRTGRTRGYTSRGVGVSIAAARFNCPPEITLHTLVRGAS